MPVIVARVLEGDPNFRIFEYCPLNCVGISHVVAFGFFRRLVPTNKFASPTRVNSRRTVIVWTLSVIANGLSVAFPISRKEK